MPLPITARTIDAVYDAILTAWKAHADVALPGVPVAYDNVPFDPEAAFDATDPEDDRWLRISVQHTPAGSGIAALGSSYYRRTGIVIVQCFTRVNTGRVLSNATVEAVINFFETAQLPGIWFREQSPSEAGDDGAWYQVNVSAVFTYDTLRT